MGHLVNAIIFVEINLWIPLFKHLLMQETEMRNNCPDLDLQVVTRDQVTDEEASDQDVISDSD